eukprot:m.201227 g.201227  ORF g.201227 m.201227 type:complete len:263 (-) comp53827_c0_seq1:2122-2910(-)
MDEDMGAIEAVYRQVVGSTTQPAHYHQLKAILLACGVGDLSDAQAHTMAASLDLNGDGFVDLEEIKVAFRQHFGVHGQRVSRPEEPVPIEQPEEFGDLDEADTQPTSPQRHSPSHPISDAERPLQRLSRQDSHGSSPRSPKSHYFDPHSLPGGDALPNLVSLLEASSRRRQTASEVKAQIEDVLTLLTQSTRLSQQDQVALLSVMPPCLACVSLSVSFSLALFKHTHFLPFGTYAKSALFFLASDGGQLCKPDEYLLAPRAP